MTRREILALSAAFTGVAGMAGIADAVRLVPPASAPVNVAFVVSPEATLIDFVGPWQIFANVMLSSTYSGDMPASSQATNGFNLFMVSESTAPISVDGGLVVVPRHTLEKAPRAQVIMVGAQRASSQTVEWIREMAPKAQLVASVCTGAGVLARAGLLDGQKATTHHDFYDLFDKRYPRVQWIRGPRWIEQDGGRTATSGGEASGMDLALRIVERYYGADAARRASVYTEYAANTPRPA